MLAELLFVGAIVIVVCWFLTHGRRRPTVPLLGELTDRIDVTVKWNGPNLDINVKPKCAEIKEGAQVSWYHDVDGLQVVPNPVLPGDKKKVPWPYVKAPQKAGKGQPVRSGPMKGKPELELNKLSGYTLVMDVSPADGTPIRQIRLDPDIIIREEDRKSKKTS
jgi:hypothetical protein